LAAIQFHHEGAKYTKFHKGRPRAALSLLAAKKESHAKPPRRKERREVFPLRNRFHGNSRCLALRAEKTSRGAQRHT
jgi:hypothetical protein